jgi:phosphate/sulfate permease
MGSKYRDISAFTCHIGNEITLKHLEEALMSNFPYNSPAEAVLAEELAAVTEQNRKSGYVLMYFSMIKLLLVGSLVALGIWGQGLDTNTKVNIMVGVIGVGIAAVIIGPLVIVGRRAILPLVATFTFAAIAATLAGKFL